MNISNYQPPLAAVNHCVYRLVPSIFPPVSLFDRVSRPENLETAFAFESETNPRLRNEVGDISLVPVEDRVTGPGTTPIMASFTHIDAEGARFTTGEFSAYYAGDELETSIQETKYHREVFLADAEEDPIDIDMRCYIADLEAHMHDLRVDAPAALYDPDCYAASQLFASRIRDEGSDGLIYNSVRREGGTCYAVFRPRLLSNCRQERHLTYRWDGEKITVIYEKRAFGGPDA